MLSGVCLFSFGMFYYVLNHPKKNNLTNKSNLHKIGLNKSNLNKSIIKNNKKLVMVDSATQTEILINPSQSTQTELFINENHFINSDINKIKSDNILDDWSII